MANNYGTGVSRVLDPRDTQYTTVLWQQGKPPLDSELNLISDASEAQRRLIVSSGMPSGWLGNGINDSDAFITRPEWSNWFRFGQQATGELKSVQWAAVNGWIIPVSGTLTGTPPGSPDDASTWNRVTLSPPPSNSGDSRIDFVFLEAWKALLPPNPSSTNKPAASSIYRYGNVEGGYSYLADDLKDPALGFETTQRVQIQYRIRVVTGLVGLQSFPDGFDPANVKAWGTTSADTAFTFANMRKALGDPGLWRAGDGTPNALGTVDGYSYAIPLAVIFRRNSVAWDGDPGQNLNGGFNRNPTAVDRTGWTTFSTEPTLASDMDATQTTLTLASATSIPLPTSPSTTIQVGDEIMQYSSITGTTLTLTSRGALGTRAEAHTTGDVVRVVPGRPDGLFADQVAQTDILDLRHIVSPNGFNYTSILQSNLDKLLRGELRQNWKRTGGGPQGGYTIRQDKISASAAALGVSKLDAPDNVRQIWSDTSVLQPVEFIAVPPSSPGAAVDISSTWGLALSATINAPSAADNFKPGDVITIPISQFKSTVPGSDSDQVSFPKLDASVDPVVQLRLGGSSTNLVEGTDFTVATPTGPDDDLVITLEATFNGSAVTEEHLFITFHVQYGPGRGLSARPDSIHSVAFLNVTSGALLRQRNTSANNIPTATSWAPLWSKFRGTPLNGVLPVTAESYVDPGSKTVVLTPFRSIDLPGGTTFPFKGIVDATLHADEGPMPSTTAFTGASDPLELFDGDNGGSSTYVIFPRNLFPSWGEYHVPIVHTDTTDFSEGINFGFLTVKGDQDSDNIANFVPNIGEIPPTFSTIDLTSSTAIAYNSSAVYAPFALTYAGMRHFTDSRGLGRQGLELPPFYGIARLFAVYAASDFTANSSAYNPVDRSFVGGATNLLRQDVEAPTFWIEIDSNGDSTFVLNAECIKDYSTSTEYVIEADIFGFDRGAFDLSDSCRIVPCRTRPSAGTAIATTSVDLVIPAPVQGADSVAVNFSRTPYQGSAWLSQGNGQDELQRVGPLTSADAYQLANTELDLENLTRPNQKALEVLASVAFQTTFGTGRWAGEWDNLSTLSPQNPGWQDTTNYPPAIITDDRPTLEIDGVLGSEDALLPLGTEYHGCTSRLPLGSFFRDHDFRGDALLPSLSGLVYSTPSPGTEATALGRFSTIEQRDVLSSTASQASGGPGEIVVHVDGETQNYATLTNYRTTRGGSAFMASGPRPGGELSTVFGVRDSAAVGNATLGGVAYLVRNRPTSIGSTEVSAGSELMMLIATTVTRAHDAVDVPVRLLVGTNGSGEGFSAADLYRIEGRPLVNDGVRQGVNPSEVNLVPTTSLKPKLGA